MQKLATSIPFGFCLQTAEKIARIARNSTIFGPNESSRRDLFLEKISKERNLQKFSKKSKKIRKTFRKNLRKNFDQILII